MTGRRVTGFSIAFVKEAMEGEVLDIAVSAGEGKGYVTASHSRGRCFDARLTFEPEDT